ncbi:hypothetical protein GCM10022214_45240 [Actinomadura miaoliensis]|uniref:Uncharacterized protein n=1 Tax=Actinomadura miaoliensis TaxID=430685 RepID=A0ABP7W571_9ACTN
MCAGSTDGPTPHNANTSDIPSRLVIATERAASLGAAVVRMLREQDTGPVLERLGVAGIGRMSVCKRRGRAQVRRADLDLLWAEGCRRSRREHGSWSRSGCAGAEAPVGLGPVACCYLGDTAAESGTGAAAG